MVVAIKKLLGIVLLALLSALVHGAEEPAANVPDPTALAGDWWSYFEPKEPVDKEALLLRG